MVNRVVATAPRKPLQPLVNQHDIQQANHDNKQTTTFTSTSTTPTLVSHLRRPLRFPVASPPPTDPIETVKLWACVRRSTEKERMPQPKSKSHSESTGLEDKTAGKGTHNYKVQELESRHITIVQTSAPMSTWLPKNDGTASAAELEHLYVPSSHDFRANVRKWAQSCLEFSNPPLPEFQWTVDLYLQFLRGRTVPHCPGEDDVIILERNLQPWVSFKQNTDILLPPKDLLAADNSSMETIALGKRPPRVKRSKRERLSQLPAEIGTEDGGEQKSSVGTRIKQHGMRPDIMYACKLTVLEDVGLYLKFPAIRTFSSSNRLPPYLIGELKNTQAQVEEARQPLALIGAMMLLERVKLRRMSPNRALDDIKLFLMTCCGPLVEIYCMMIPTAGDHCQVGDVLSYNMNWCAGYLLSHERDIMRLGNDLNSIHTYGQTVHLTGIKNDLTAVSDVSLAAVDKHSYQYTNFNTFDQGDILVMREDQETDLISTDNLSSSLPAAATFLSTNPPSHPCEAAASEPILDPTLTPTSSVLTIHQTHVHSSTTPSPTLTQVCLSGTSLVQLRAPLGLGASQNVHARRPSRLPRPIRPSH